MDVTAEEQAESSASKNLQLPGHIRKAFRSLEKFLPAVDIILELVDARMPEGSRPGQLVAKLHKDTVIVLGKADLADPEETTRWREHFCQAGCQCLPFSLNDKNAVTSLLKMLREMPLVHRAKTGRSFRRIMVVGIPNVGKSSLINVLSGRRAARVANLPGVTRNIQWIKLPGDLELLDLPGILDFALLKKGEVLRLINTIPGPEEDPEQQSRVLIQVLIQAGAEQMISGLAEYRDQPGAFLEAYSLAMNFLLRGGAPDIRRGARDFLRRFHQGGFGRITLEKPGAELILAKPGAEPEAAKP